VFGAGFGRHSFRQELAFNFLVPLFKQTIRLKEKNLMKPYLHAISLIGR
jgi:hypothetical protein